MALEIPHEVAGAFGLAGVRAVDEFESWGNQNFLVDVGGERYVMRQHRLNASARRLELQVGLQEHLVLRRFPTATVIRTKAGEPYAIDINGTPWAVSSFVEGADYDFGREAQSVEAGRTLARFHLLSEPYEHDGPGPQYKAPLLECCVDPVRDVDALADLLDSRAIDRVEALREWWRSVVGEWPYQRMAALPSGWVHGDFHGRNVVYQGDRIVGVFDFDDVDRGPYAFDLAVGMFRFGRTGRGMLAMRPAFVRAFLAGYESVRPITGEERAALPVFLAMRYPPHPQHYAYWRDERGQDIEERFTTEVDAILSRQAQVLRFGDALFRVSAY